jgi:hypothetical protein
MPYLGNSFAFVSNYWTNPVHPEYIGLGRNLVGHLWHFYQYPSSLAIDERVGGFFGGISADVRSIGSAMRSFKCVPINPSRYNRYQQQSPLRPHFWRKRFF